MDTFPALSFLRGMHGEPRGFPRRNLHTLIVSPSLPFSLPCLPDLVCCIEPRSKRRLDSQIPFIPFRLGASTVSMTMSTKPGRILPREGFHVGVLATFVRKTLLNPVLLLPALLLGRYTYRGRLFAQDNSRLLSWLNTFTVLGFIRVVNSWLNHRALNNGVKDTYKWSQELVLITGGSDGIGARIVQMLAERSIKVVVLDVQPLTFERGEYS